MTDSVPYQHIILYVVLGFFGACVLLYYLRELDVHKKYRLLAFGLFIVAAFYVLFAIVTLNKLFITVEIVGMLLFLIFIWMAFHYSMWFVALGWAAHIVWDIGVHPQETAPYVPYWYAWICVGFDAVIVMFMSFTLTRHD